MNNIMQEIQNLLPGFGRNASYRRSDNNLFITVSLSIPKELGIALRDYVFDEKGGVIFGIRRCKDKSLYQLYGQVCLDCNKDLFDPHSIYYVIYEELKALRNHLLKSQEERIKKVQYKLLMRNYK